MFKYNSSLVITTKWFLFFTTIALLLTLKVSSAADSSENTLRFAVHVSEMGNLDPHFAAGSQDRAFSDMVFNGLLRYRPGNAPQLEPDLAETIPEFKMIAGQQVWTIKLRQGVMFHSSPNTPAYELTADDVVFSLKKSADEKFSAYAGAYSGMTVEKISTYSVRITLEKPASPILFLPKLTNYAGGFIVSKKAIESMGYDGFKAHPIGTGPFMFASHEPSRKITLNRHTQYFRGKPHLDSVEMFFISDVASREDMLFSGKLDLIAGSGKQGWLAKMEQQQGVVIDTFGVGEVTTIYLNPNIKPLDDARVRRAIAYALNRKKFLPNMSKPIVGSVYSPVPAQFLPGGLSHDEVKALGLDYEFNLEKARELLREAGYPSGFSLALISSEKRLYRRNYEALRDHLARIDIICNIEVVSHAEMHKLVRRKNHPLIIYAAWRPNADAYLSRFFHSDSIIVTGKSPDTNFSSYDKIDKLIESARMEIFPEKQIRLWNQAQIRILEDMVALPIMFTKQLFVKKSYVDYGHDLISTMALYPQITENTRLIDKPALPPR